jgi:hypothetical protein
MVCGCHSRKRLRTPPAGNARRNKTARFTILLPPRYHAILAAGQGLT